VVQSAGRIMDLLLPTFNLDVALLFVCRNHRSVLIVQHAPAMQEDMQKKMSDILETSADDTTPDVNISPMNGPLSAAPS